MTHKTRFNLISKTIPQKNNQIIKTHSLKIVKTKQHPAEASNKHSADNKKQSRKEWDRKIRGE